VNVPCIAGSSLPDMSISSDGAVPNVSLPWSNVMGQVTPSSGLW